MSKITTADISAVFRALWNAAEAITENEFDGGDSCRYCGAEDALVGDEFRIDHGAWCPSHIIDHAFDGLDEGLASRVIAAMKAEDGVANLAGGAL